MSDQSSMICLPDQHQAFSHESYWDSEVDLWFQEQEKGGQAFYCPSPFAETHTSPSSGSESFPDYMDSDNPLCRDSEPHAQSNEEGTLQGPHRHSDPKLVLASPVFQNENAGMQIWQTTISYLTTLSSKAPGVASESLLSLIASLIPQAQGTEDVLTGSFVLMMHALRVAATKRGEEVRDEEQRRKVSEEARLGENKKGRKMHLKAPPAMSKFNHHRTAKAPVKVRAKTGRKPQAYPCFLCSEVCPYRVSLIKHFQEVHHLKKSQSLLYKRIRQGAECIKRLYHFQ